MRQYVEAMGRQAGAEIHPMDGGGAGLWTPDCLMPDEDADRLGIERGRYGDQPYPITPDEAAALVAMSRAPKGRAR